MRGTRFWATGILMLLMPFATPAGAESPYDMTYSVRADTPVRTAMKPGAKVKATLKAGTSGIVMRWCRPEIPFAKWEFGGSSARTKLLKERWCEIQSGSVVGNVEGKDLRPE